MEEEFDDYLEGMGEFADDISEKENKGYYLVILDSIGGIENIITDPEEIMEYVRNEESSEGV